MMTVARDATGFTFPIHDQNTFYTLAAQRKTCC
jgi:hypothetical protein